MSSIFQINGTDIDSWSNKIESRSALPSLIRRLARLHGRKLVKSEFRADEGVQIKGWDGHTIAAEDSDFVPQGPAAWEMGTGKEPETKANSDYKKRTENPKGINPAESTFVFVTSRRWEGKDEWKEEREAEAIWKYVRVFDADNLATLLEQSVSVSTWLSTMMGKRIEGCVDLGYFWDAWRNSTKPPTVPRLLTVDRDADVERIINWLSSDDLALVVRADHKDTAVAFLAASIWEASPDLIEEQMANIVVVETIEAFRQLAQSDTPLILVAMLDNLKELSVATANGHKVLIPVEKQKQVDQNALTLSAQNRSSLQKVLEEQGMTFEQSKSQAALARKSMSAYRRDQNTFGAPETPNWARPESSRELLVPLLVGTWEADHKGDQAVIEAISGRSYVEVEADCTKWAAESDPPIRRVGNRWAITNRRESWAILAKYFTENDLNRFGDETVKTLSTPDPKFDLELRQRFMAQVLGKGPVHSYVLQKGLADGLALMAATSASVSLPGLPGDVRATLAVRAVFKNCETPQGWASLAPLMPLLAEAAPEEFLSICEKDLASNQFLITLFEDGKDIDPMHSSSSPHCSLLWALETLAWNPKYLARAALVLANLTEKEPGGRQVNRPGHSLQEIFLSWYPSTTATLDERIEVIDLLRRRNPGLAWQLMLSLFPDHRSVSHSTSKPEYRDWLVGWKGGASYGEIARNIHELVSRFIADAGQVGARWNSMLGHLNQLSPEDFKLVVDQMKVAVTSMTDEDKATLREGLREVISQHLRFPDANWTLPRPELDALKVISDSIESRVGMKRFEWLFRGDPDIYIEGSDWRAKELEVSRLRQEAATVLFAEAGFNGLMEFAQVLEFPAHLGRAISDATLGQEVEDRILSDCLGSDDVKKRELGSAYLGAKTNSQDGSNWALEFVRGEQFRKFKPLGQADFYSYLPFNDETWKSLAALAPETQGLYWRYVSIWGRGEYGEINGDYVVEHLLNVERFGIAIEFITLLNGPNGLAVSPELGLRAIELFLNAPKPEGFNWHNIAWSLGKLLDLLHKAGAEIGRIVFLEYLLFPILDRQSENGTNAIFEQLGIDPDFFISIVRDLRGEVHGEVSEDEKQVCHERAFEILHSWHECPGQTTGDFDFDRLREWVSKSRELAAGKEYEGLVDHYIGERLRHTPDGPNDQWPSDEVCEIIETICSEAIDDGFRVEITNSRGVTVRGLEDGGAQERGLVEKYSTLADKIRNRFPRVSSILSDVSRSYEHEARREDTGAELNQDRD